MVVNDPLKVEDLIEPFRAEFERQSTLYQSHFTPSYDCSFEGVVEFFGRYEDLKHAPHRRALYRATKTLQIAEGKCPDLPLDEQGPDAALLWKLAN